MLPSPFANQTSGCFDLTTLVNKERNSRQYRGHSIEVTCFNQGSYDFQTIAWHSACKHGLSWRGMFPVVTWCVSIQVNEISLLHASTTVVLGKERCEVVPTRLHGREILTGESGLSGSGLLSRFRIAIRASRGQVILRQHAKLYQQNIQHK